MSTGLPLALAVLGPACTRVNPGFGDGTDAASGTGESGDTQDDESVSASTTMTTSATTSASTTDDPSDGSSDSGGETMECGNGTREGEEQCDDGEDNGDTRNCTSMCRHNKCGDGLPGPGQPCDDGNDVDDDACSNACVPETCGNMMHDEGEECDPTAPSGDVLCTPVCQINTCHDGHHLGDEKCDDGNTDDDDACVDECEVATCGDSHIQAVVEECDDGNTANDDECVACVPAQCNDGFVHVGMEGCDPAADSSFACASNGFFGGEGVCTDDCEIDLSSCTNCGNGLLDPDDGEECDFGGEEVLACGEAGWQGDGNVFCADDCQATPMGECCLPDDAPCIPAPNSLCCGQCNQETALCEGDDG